MLTISIVMLNSGTVLDIMVKPEQRIRDVLKVLDENGKIMCGNKMDHIRTKSWRLGRTVNNLLTFKQAQIQSGDIIYVEVEVI